MSSNGLLQWVAKSSSTNGQRRGPDKDHDTEWDVRITVTPSFVIQNTLDILLVSQSKLLYCLVSGEEYGQAQIEAYKDVQDLGKVQPFLEWTKESGSYF